MATRIKTINLTTENLVNPFGIDEKTPEFRWQVKTDAKGWKQVRYRVLVSTSQTDFSENFLVWDSGEISSRSMKSVYQGAPLASDTAYYWKVTLAGTSLEQEKETLESDTGHFHTALFSSEDWGGRWIGETRDFVNSIFRKDFTVSRPIAKASLYISGLGHNEVYINGDKLGNRVLEPGWTVYDKTCLYSAYDITRQLQSGDNRIGVLLGDGMYNVPGGRYVYYERTHGKMKLLVELRITFEGGDKQRIVTDESWETTKSPLTFSCIYGGEDFDGRLWEPDFTLPEFHSSATWEQATVVPAPKGKLVAQFTHPLKVKETYAPVEIKEVGNGTFLYDFGTNFSGWAEITLSWDNPKSGHSVTMTTAEKLTKEGLPDQRGTGEGYAWTYLTNQEKVQQYRPRFTYTGFRYLLLEGAVPPEFSGNYPELPVAKTLEGQFIYPDFQPYGQFSCSNSLWNQIHGIVTQAMLSNTKSIFTDCPHREKLGWLEQTHLIGPGLMYNYDVENLYRKILRDMEDAQHESGLVPDTAPEYVVFGYHEGFIDSPEWGSTAVISPWYLYKCYGNQEILKTSYPMMKKYVDYLTGKTHHKVLHHGLGDWLDIGPCNPYSQNTPVPVVATSVYYFDLRIIATVAEMLGKTEDAVRYKTLAEEVKAEFDLQFYDDQTGRYANGSQAAQALALVTGIGRKEEEERILEHLVRDIEGRDYMTTAGDVGHPFVLAALTLARRSDVIAAMTNVTDRPSYGYQVKSGATTLTEQWDGPNPERMRGSQNHFMLGAIEEWFYAGLAGIQRIRKNTGYQVVEISPSFVESCERVSAWTMHPHGKIAVQWEKQQDGVLVEVTIPPNTSADLFWETTGEQARIDSGEYRFLVPYDEKKQVKELTP